MDTNKLNVTYHGVDPSDALNEKIEERTESLLSKYDSSVTRMEWVVSQENPKESKGEELFKTSVRIHLKQKREVHASSQHNDVYHTVSDAAKKAQQQLNKLK